MKSFGIMKGKRVRNPGKLYQIRAFAKYQSIALCAAPHGVVPYGVVSGIRWDMAKCGGIGFKTGG